MTEECPRCGGTNPAGATECQWCGVALGPAPAEAPLPPSTTSYRSLEFARTPSGTAGPPPDFTSERPVGVILVMVIAVVVVLILAAVLISVPSAVTTPSASGGGPIDITGVTVSSPDNACGLNGVTFPEISGPVLPAAIGWGLPEHGHSYPCTVTNVSSDTPGFTVSANLPMTVTAPDTVLMVSLGYPPSYSGALHLIFY